MTRIRPRGEEVRRYILENVEQHPQDIAKLTAEHFNISRQAVNIHLQKLVTEACLIPKENQQRNRSYRLAPLVEWRKTYILNGNLAEDIVWRDDISLVLGVQPENISDIWLYGFTEMFNNALDHSAGTTITVVIKKTAISTEMLLLDDGVGIFKKIQKALNLLDERHAVLELSKGKFTTDPSKHTGEGIFFSSRVFDSFDIMSGSVFFTHKFGNPEDWILETNSAGGTAVWMRLLNHSARTLKKVFADYAPEPDGDYRFTKTVVPVRLAQYGNDKLVSRSQAKRLLARVELFKTVLFDFAEVETIGQAFADEIFRVFSNAHENISIMAINTNPEIDAMISRTQFPDQPDSDSIKT